MTSFTHSITVFIIYFFSFNVKNLFFTGLENDISGTSTQQHRDMREKLARLERENVRLRAANNNEESSNNKGNAKDNDNTTSTPTNASIDELKELLEDEIRLKNRFQNDSREANAKAEALIVEFNLFKESQLNNSNNGNNGKSGNSGDANTTQVTVSRSKSERCSAKCSL